MDSNTLLNNSDRVNSLIEDCTAIWVENDFNSRWYRVKGYHELGKRLLEEPNEYGDKFVPLVAKSIGKSKRNIYRAIAFAKKFPDLDSIPVGKNISWYRVIHTYLPTEPKDARKTPDEMIFICPNCNTCYEKSSIKFERKFND